MVEKIITVNMNFDTYRLMISVGRNLPFQFVEKSHLWALCWRIWRGGLDTRLFKSTSQFPLQKDRNFPLKSPIKLFGNSSLIFVVKFNFDLSISKRSYSGSNLRKNVQGFFQFGRNSFKLWKRTKVTLLFRKKYKL